MGSCPIAGSHPGGELSYSGESSWWGVVLVGSSPGGELSWWGVVL